MISLNNDSERINIFNNNNNMVNNEKLDNSE